MALPDFLCVGAQKAGTSWLREMLNSHPDIWMGLFKELHYFDSLYNPKIRRWGRDAVRVDVKTLIRHHVVNAVEAVEEDEREPTMAAGIDLDLLKRYIRLAENDFIFTRDWYQELFNFPAGAGKLKGEITPEYGSIPAEGIQYLRELLGPVPIIYLIRDPVGRALSHLRMRISRRENRIEFSDEEWTKMMSNRAIMVNTDYKANVSRWMQNYPNEKLLFLPYRDVGTRPHELLAEVTAFVGAPAHKYDRALQQIYKGAAIDIPPFVIERMQELLADQYSFLAATFGTDFCSRI